MFQQSLRNLVSLAKQRDKKKFLNAVEQSKVLQNLNSLHGKEVSQLIYCFSKAEIHDTRYWKSLHESFLSRYTRMNTIDLVMCSYGFAKNFSSNTERYTSKGEEKERIDVISLALEKQLLATQDQLLESQSRSSNIGLLLYSSHVLDRVSPTFWLMMERILEERCQFLDQRNLTMACYVLSKREIGNGRVWQALENQILTVIGDVTWRNLILIIFSFSRMKVGREMLWQEFDTKLIRELKSRTRHSINNLNVTAQVSGDTLNDALSQRTSWRDICQILWSLASLRKGSEQLWSMLETVVVENGNKNDLTSFNKCLFSFYFAEKGSVEFWKAISQVDVMSFSRGRSSQMHVILDEILYLARIYAEKQSEGIKFNFAPLIAQFERITTTNSESFVKSLGMSKARLSFHEILFSKNPKLLTFAVAEGYLQKLTHAANLSTAVIDNHSLKQADEDWLQMYIDFSYIVFDLKKQEELGEIQMKSNQLLFSVLKRMQRFENNPKLFSGVAWVLQLSLNEWKGISNLHRIELVNCFVEFAHVFFEDEKKFMQIAQKILSPVAQDKSVFENIMKSIETNEEFGSPLRHLCAILFIGFKNNYRFEGVHFSIFQKRLVNSNPMPEFVKAQQIQLYEAMYNKLETFSFENLIRPVLENCFQPSLRIEDIQQSAQNETKEGGEQSKKSTQTRSKNSNNNKNRNNEKKSQLDEKIISDFMNQQSKQDSLEQL